MASSVSILAGSLAKGLEGNAKILNCTLSMCMLKMVYCSSTVQTVEKTMEKSLTKI